jgi:hypothetical protein
MTNIISNGLSKYYKIDGLSKGVVKDGLYYVLKYDDSLQALGNGSNILNFTNNAWENCGEIYVLNKTNLNSYHINLLTYLVYKHLDDKSIVNNQWLVMKNGLALECDNKGWKIVFEKDTSEESFKKWGIIIFKELIGYTIVENKNDFLIKIDLIKDLVEEGIKIVSKLSSITV